jgi:hypothetical protein
MNQRNISKLGIGGWKFVIIKSHKSAVDTLQINIPKLIIHLLTTAFRASTIHSRHLVTQRTLAKGGQVPWMLLVHLKASSSQCMGSLGHYKFSAATTMAASLVSLAYTSLG